MLIKMLIYSPEAFLVRLNSSNDVFINYYSPSIRDTSQFLSVASAILWNGTWPI